jgi:hypothetical protein
MKKYYILVLIVLMGCGSRKKQLKGSVEKRDVVELVNNDISSNVRIERRADVVIYTPIDPDRPMVLPDGTKTKNVRIEKRTEAETKSEEKADRTTKEKKETSITKDKDLAVESKRGDFWRTFTLPVGIGLGLAIVAAVILYYLYRKTK